MKKIIRLVALVLSLMLLLTGAALAEDNSLQNIKNKGTMVLGLDASFPPMGFINDDGEIVGYDIDLAKEVCARLGVELVCQPIDWSAKDMELSSGNIDCIWNGMTATEERQQTYSCSINYLQNAQVLVVLADSEVKTLADLAGKTIALQSGSAAVEAVAANEAFSASLAGAPIEFADYAMALMDLDNKGVDAVAMDVIVANYYITAKQANYRVLEEQLAPEFYAIGFRKGETALTEEVNKILKEMAADGTIAKISTEWFGQDISIVPAE
jgi:polar amino acid transport system substrate-binding protein